MSRTKVPMSGPLQPCLVDLREQMLERGYAAGTVDQFERTLGKLSAWLLDQGVPAAEFSPALVKLFIAEHQPVGATSMPPGLSTVLTWLRDHDVIPLPAPSPSELVLREYGRYLRVERRLAELTVVTSCDVARRFRPTGWSAAACTYRL